MLPASTARIAGSHLCSIGVGRDPGNRVCENVALPGFDLCPAHENLSRYLEDIARGWDEEHNTPNHSAECLKYGDDSRCNACNGE